MGFGKLEILKDMKTLLTLFLLVLSLTGFGQVITLNYIDSMTTGGNVININSDVVYLRDYPDPIAYYFKTGKTALSGTSTIIDYSGNDLDASLVASRCGTVTTGSVFTFESNIGGTLGNWVMTKQGTATPVLSLTNITFSGAGTIYDLRLVNSVLGKTLYYPICEGELTLQDVSGNSNDITVTATYANFIASTQNTFHYNLLNGGSRTSGELLANTTFAGTYAGGLAPGWTTYLGTGSEETTIVRDGYTKAQRYSYTTGAELYPTNYTSFVHKIGTTYWVDAWIYLVSGSVYLRQDGVYNQDRISDILTTTGAWTHLQCSFVENGDRYGAPYLCIQTYGAGTTDFIVQNFNAYAIYPDIRILALENSNTDTRGNTKEISNANAKRYCETSIKLPLDTNLIHCDDKHIFFSLADSTPQNVLLRTLFYKENMTNNNKIFSGTADCGNILFYENKVGNNANLEHVLDLTGSPSAYFYRPPVEDSIPIKRSWSSGKYVVGHHYNTVVTATIYYSSDTGKTFSSAAYGATMTLGTIRRLFVTEKGTIVAFCHNNVVKRSANGGTTWTDVAFKNADGSPFVKHTPANASYPGTYYTPYDRWREIHDAGTGNNIIVWGNYNTGELDGAAPVIIWSSNDDMVNAKVVYTFGQNTHFRDDGTSTGGETGTLLGDAGNSIICRHIHGMEYKIIPVIGTL